jgi:hypothetical protein
VDVLKHDAESESNEDSVLINDKAALHRRPRHERERDEMTSATLAQLHHESIPRSLQALDAVLNCRIRAAASDEELNQALRVKYQIKRRLASVPAASIATEAVSELDLLASRQTRAA